MSVAKPERVIVPTGETEIDADSVRVPLSVIVPLTESPTACVSTTEPESVIVPVGLDAKLAESVCVPVRLIVPDTVSLTRNDAVELPESVIVPEGESLNVVPLEAGWSATMRP